MINLVFRKKKGGKAAFKGRHREAYCMHYMYVSPKALLLLYRYMLKYGHLHGSQSVYFAIAQLTENEHLWLLICSWRRLICHVCYILNW